MWYEVMKMSASKLRYSSRNEKTDSAKGHGFAKKFAFQTVASVCILGASVFACNSNFPYSENFKTYIKRSLNVSTDISKVKSAASFAIKKSGLDSIEVIKNIDDRLNEGNVQNSEIPNESDAEAASENIEPPSETASEIETVNTPPAETKPQTNPGAMPAFRNPAEGKISSVFGERVHPVTGADGNFHTGIDIAGIMNQTVISAAEGKVIKTSEDSANGKYVIIEHTGGYTTAYAHLNKICVTEGEYVDNNTKIGQMGESGIATGVHLHFEIKKNGERLNPEDFVLYKHK